MSIHEYVNQLECFKNALSDFKPFAEAVQSVHAMRVERIFTRGENSNGQQIGQYNSTNPLYINPDKAARKTRNVGKGIAGLKPVGKHGDTVFKSTGKPHKTAYVNSYKELREKLGRPTSFVNLTMFGNLKSNFANGGRGENAPAEAIKISPSEYIVGLDSENSLKKSGLEEKYNAPIFKHTPFELAEYQRINRLGLLNSISKCE